MTTAAPKLGLPAEYGMSWMLPRLVGVTRAADLLLSGRVVTGAETDGWGLWNGVAADGEAALAAAHAYATTLATTVGPTPCGSTKRQLYDDLLPPRRRRVARRGAAAAGRGDGDRRVPRGRRRPAASDAPPELLTAVGSADSWRGDRTSDTRPRPSRRPAVAASPVAQIAGLASRRAPARSTSPRSASTPSTRPSPGIVRAHSGAFQLGAGSCARARRPTAGGRRAVGLSVAIVGGWCCTRLSGIALIDGLEHAEAAQFADTVCAVLGVVAARWLLARRRCSPAR